MKQAYTLAALALVITTATPAFGQDVRVRVDTRAIQEAAEEIRKAMREAFGPEMRMDLQREIRSVTRDVQSIGREISAALSDVTREISREVSREWSFPRDWRGWSAERQRNFPASQTDTETRTFNIGASGEFELENLSGDIQIMPGSGRDITIEITRRARGRTDNDARTGLQRVRVETTHQGSRVRARVDYPTGRQTTYSVSVDFVIKAPVGTRVTARTLSGDVTAGGLQGELALSSTSGDVKVTDASRLLSAKTASGDIILTNVGAEGLLEAHTMSGDVTATNLKARRADLTTVSGSVTGRGLQTGDVKMSSTSGDVFFDGDLAENGRYTFISHSGDVRLAVDGRTGFSFEASTFSGTVRSDLPLQVTGMSAGRRPARNLRGTFGNGSAIVSATSFSGSVVVTKR